MKKINKINQYFLGLKFAFSYFTILPINFKKEDDLIQKNVLNSMLYFLPFVGFILGVFTIFLYGFLNNLEWWCFIMCFCIYVNIWFYSYRSHFGRC